MKIVKTLYVVSVWDPDTQTPMQVTYFYAKTPEEAEQRGHAWRDESHPSLQHVEVRQHPNGFRLVSNTLPGTVEVTEN